MLCLSLFTVQEGFFLGGGDMDWKISFRKTYTKISNSYICEHFMSSNFFIIGSQSTWKTAIFLIASFKIVAISLFMLQLCDKHSRTQIPMRHRIIFFCFPRVWKVCLLFCFLSQGCLRAWERLIYQFLYLKIANKCIYSLNRYGVHTLGKRQHSFCRDW